MNTNFRLHSSDFILAFQRRPIDSNVMRLIFLSWLMFFVVACNQPMPTHLLPQQPVPSDTTITLERSVCYGTCPDYKVTISADGKVTFEGHQFVKTKGTAQGNIDLDSVRLLIGEFDKAKYFSLNDKYETAKDGCPENWTDHPTVVTAIKMNGKSKSISHYHGCREGQIVYPKALTDLEDRIDEIVGTKQWIK